jgi:glycosyl transferase family 2
MGAHVAVRGAAAGAVLLTAHALLNLRLLRTPGCVRPHPRPDLALVSVLVPARNEAARISPCVEALRGQRGVALELLVLDDGSTDGTADRVRTVAGGDPQVRILEGKPLPPGWLGKPHACAQLAEAARGEVLVFVDADVEVAPDGIAATVALLDEAGLDLVCPYPRQRVDTLGERLVQPLLQWSWLSFLPLRLAERLPFPSLCAANGQLLACRVDAYWKAGGHEAVRDQVIEDIELGRAFKRAGLRVAIADGTNVATCRMYAGWEELRDGYTKSLWAAFGSPRGAALTVGVLGWLYIVPAVAAVAGIARRDRAAAMGGLAGYVAGVAGRLACARRTGGRPLDALAHPASIATLSWLIARSLRHKATGRLHWRGRTFA